MPAPRVPRGPAYLALAAAGFWRYATYRQAMVAAIFTNSIFGFLRCSVLLALAGAGTVAGYDEPRLATFVWAGQGLIGVVLLWSPNELADRIRTGDVIADLLRPIDLVWQLLAADLGRAGLAVLTRFVGPVVVGALAFHLYAPRRLATYILFACSMLLATDRLLRLPLPGQCRGVLAPGRARAASGLDAPVSACSAGSTSRSGFCPAPRSCSSSPRRPFRR